MSHYIFRKLAWRIRVLGLSPLPPDEAPLPLARKRKRLLAMPATGSVDAERRPQARASGSAGSGQSVGFCGSREAASGQSIGFCGSRGIGWPWPGPTRVLLAQPRPGSATLGPAQPGSTRLGSARLGSARLGSAPFGSSSTRPGSAWLHSARPGLARLPSARLSPAWLHSACLGVLGWSAVCGHFRPIGCRSAGVGQGSKKGELIYTSTWPARCQRHPTTYLIRNA